MKIMPTILTSIANTTNEPLFLKKRINLSPHNQLKMGILFCLSNNKFKETRLCNNRDERKFRFEQVKGSNFQAAIADLKGNSLKSGVTQLQKAVSETKLIEIFHNNGMESITAKLALKVHMGLKQSYANTFASEKKS